MFTSDWRRTYIFNFGCDFKFFLLLNLFLISLVFLVCLKSIKNTIIMLQPNIDYLLCLDTAFVDSKSPQKMGKGVCITTKNYFFFIPLQTVGTYPMLQTFKNFHYFEGVSVLDGLQNMISNSDSVNDLEDSLSALLEDNPRNVHQIKSFKNFKVSGFFTKNVFQLIHHRFNYYACIIKPKATAGEFRKFHGI